jgi:hypothetical protein
MSEVTDIIIEDGTPNQEEDFTLLDIIENQIYIITEIMALDVDLYDKFHEDRVRTVTKAFKVIQKAQDIFLQNL